MSRSTANLSTAAAAAIATAAPWVAKNYSEPHFVTMPSVEQYRSLHQVPDAPPSTSTFIDSRRNYQPTHSSTATTASFSAEKMQHQQQSHYEAPEAFYSGDILPLPSQGSNINSNNGSNTKAVHKKALTIHIDTPHVGPNGMPLVYGSSPEGPGKIKGRVRFAANYDCKGKDIQIIYEARAEASWSII
ncbi:hypothetical protein BGZ73_000263 [Actinomortierella ambigua]|nr:hypothetical protein BGZ73_000263 [Actinomortierella ambigua]